MNLTRKEAIEEHRKMWNWIVKKLESLLKNPEEEQKSLNIIKIKSEYMKENGYKEGDIMNNCFLCEYTPKVFLSYNEGITRCHLCPLDWGEQECAAENGLYSIVDRYMRDNNIKMAIVVARRIANLPEKKEGNKNEVNKRRCN